MIVYDASYRSVQVRPVDGLREELSEAGSECAGARGGPQDGPGKRIQHARVALRA